jgi:hypothetical protein
MKSIGMIATALALFCIEIPLGAAPAQQPRTVHGEGCVEPGVENRCLMVKDLKSGILYNVHIKDPQPNIGDGIEFTAVPHGGPTTCMQGAAVDVTTWARKDSLKCGSREAPQK